MYNIVKNGQHNQYGTYRLVADNENDISNAPTNIAPGSKLFCIATSKTYILSPKKEWVEYAANGSGVCPYPHAEGKNF